MRALTVSDVAVTLDGSSILQGISFDASPGGWLGVVGPNGAGKSTLLRAVCGTVQYDGRITIDQQRVETLDRRAKARCLAMVPQTPVVPDGMRVIDYVLLGRTPHRSALAPESQADLAVARTVIEQLDLAPFARRMLTSLSGGERQRAFLARALAQQADIVLLDEPTAALDIGHQVDVLQLIDRLRRELGLTIITTLHDLTLAGRYPDTLVMLANGRVVASGTPSEVLTEDIIERHYGTPVRIIHDDGRLIVVPTARLEHR